MYKLVDRSASLALWKFHSRVCIHIRLAHLKTSSQQNQTNPSTWPSYLSDFNFMNWFKSVHSDLSVIFPPSSTLPEFMYFFPSQSNRYPFFIFFSKHCHHTFEKRNNNLFTNLQHKPARHNRTQEQVLPFLRVYFSVDFVAYSNKQINRDKVNTRLN